MAEEAISQLSISMPRFEGPFDLLLALIRNNQYSIDALPVLEITSQFLAYVKAARDLDDGLGGEFVEVASWLVLLKSRSLLPVHSDNEPSPREELRRAVLDHQTLRAATEFLRTRDGRGRRAGAGAPVGRSESLLELQDEGTPSVQDVLHAARRAMEAARAAASLQGTEESNLTVEEQIRWIARQLSAVSNGSVLSTQPWFEKQPSRGARAALLLALLELSRNEFLLLHQFQDFAPLLVKPLRAIPDDMQSGAFEFQRTDLSAQSM